MTEYLQAGERVYGDGLGLAVAESDPATKRMGTYSPMANAKFLHEPVDLAPVGLDGRMCTWESIRPMRVADIRIVRNLILKTVLT